MPPTAFNLLAPSSLRQAISGQIRDMVGADPDEALERNRQDTGLFGPDSACWKVHGDFTSMMVGGIAALLLQMLHPAALAGVWDYSNFRQDMPGRLKRTARFIAATTYGDMREAQAHIDRVRAIHARVAGTSPDGAPYRADDPALLTWVHVAEVSSFLAAYVRFVDQGFPSAAQDRYFAETSEIARRLGAREVPQSRAEVAAYLRAVRPQLRYDRRTREVADALFSQTPPVAAARPAASFALEAAKDLLPEWAAGLHGFHLPATRRAGARLAVRALGRALRWAHPNGPESRARRRAAELAGAQLRAAPSAGARSRGGALSSGS